MLRAAHVPHDPSLPTKPTAGDASWALPLPPTFRTTAVPTQTSSQLDRDLRDFARPGAASQIDEMPPFAKPSPPWIGGGMGGRNALSYEYELRTEPDDFESSAYWNPEQERLHALSSFASTSSSVTSGSSSSASSFNSSGPYTPPPSFKPASSYSSTVPDEDEAASISSTPPTQPRSTDSDSLAAPSAHPLTLDPPPHASWNFDRLFSRRRRWFGGVRVPSESFLAEPSGDGDSSPYSSTTRPVSGSPSIDEAQRGAGGAAAARAILERQSRQDRERSTERRGAGPRSVSASKLCQEFSELGNAENGVEDEARQRQRIACEVMRASAMERLALVSAHLDWTL